MQKHSENLVSKLSNQIEKKEILKITMNNDDNVKESLQVNRQIRFQASTKYLLLKFQNYN